MTPRGHALALRFAAGVVVLLTACGAMRPAKAPLDTYLHKSPCTAQARTLLVMLPGAYSHPDEFVREGFVAIVEERRLAVDVLRVDAHLGYYNALGTFLTVS